MTPLHVPSPTALLHEALNDARAPALAAFAFAGVALGVAAWRVLRNLRHNEPGLIAPAAFCAASVIALGGFIGAQSLPGSLHWPAFGGFAVLAGSLFFFADRHRFVRDPKGGMVADRWEIVLKFARFRWTRDKANRHFFITGDTGSGKTTGMNGLLTALMRRNPQLGGVVMANKGDEWFFLEWLAKKYGRSQDIIRLRPRTVEDAPGQPLPRFNVTGDSRLPFTTRARILVDTAAALNPKDEKSFFKVKGAAHISRALELLSDIGQAPTPTNAYALLTSTTELKAALERLTEVEPTRAVFNWPKSSIRPT